MAKCWTTKAGHARCGRRLATVSGFSEGVAPEGTPQRLCPHSPDLSKNDGWPTTKSIATLASAMQEGGTDQVDAMQRSDARMTANDAATRAVIQNGTNLQRGRASLRALANASRSRPDVLDGRRL